MNITNITDEYDNITSNNYDYDNISSISNCTNFENDDNDIIFKYLLFSIPSSVLLFSLISLMIYTIIKPLINNK